MSAPSQTNEKKRAIIDIIRVVFSNLCVLASGILIGFFVPKMLGYEDYGFYKTFVLYASYIGLLHFGISDGVYFYFAGKSKDELDPKRIHSILVAVILLQLVLSGLGMLVSSFFIAFSKYGLAFFLVSVYIVFLNTENILSGICQATKEFSTVSIVGVVKSLINVAYVASFFGLFHFGLIDNISFIWFCGLTIGVAIVADIFYVIKLRRFVFSKGQPIQETKEDIKVFLKVGIPLLLANFTSQLILTADKQLISIFYPVDQSNIFSIYSFAYSMLNLVTVATTAVATVLYPYLRGKPKEVLIEKYPALHSATNIFMGAACLSFFVLEWIVGRFLPKYVDSLAIFRVLVPGLLINSSVVVLMHSYYKTFDKERPYFFQNLIILGLAVLTDLLAYYCIIRNNDINNPIAITYASLFTIMVWYFLSEGYLAKKYGIRHWKGDAYVFVLAAAFLLITQFFQKWAAVALYLGFYIVWTALFYFRDLRKIVGKLSQRFGKRKASPEAEQEKTEPPVANPDQPKEEFSTKAKPIAVVKTVRPIYSRPLIFAVVFSIVFFIVTGNALTFSVLGGLVNFRISEALLLVVAVFCVCAMARRRISPFLPFKNQTFRWFFIWLGFAAVVCIPSTFINGYSPSELLVGLFYAVRLLFYVFVACTFGCVLYRSAFPKNKMVAIVVASYCAVCLIGVVQYFAFPYVYDFYKIFYAFGVYWPTPDHHVNRLVSTYFDPNYMASISIIPIALCVEKLISKKYRWHPGYLCALALLVVAVFLTKSRSGFLALGILVVFEVARFFFKNLDNIASAAVVLASVVAIGILATSNLSVVQRVMAGLSDESSSARFESWRIGLDAFAQHPVFGIGYNMTGAYNSRVLDVIYASSVNGNNSSLIQIAMTSGVVGILLFGAYLVSSFKSKSLSFEFKAALAAGLVICNFNQLLLYPLWLFVICLLEYSSLLGVAKKPNIVRAVLITI